MRSFVAVLFSCALLAVPLPAMASDATATSLQALIDAAESGSTITLPAGTSA